MKRLLPLVLMAGVLTLSSCMTTSFTDGALVKDDQVVGYCNVIFPDETVDSVVFLSVLEKSIRDRPDMQLSLKRTDTISAVLLRAGRYYYTVGGFGRVVFFLNDPQIVINPKASFINYLGTFVVKIDRKAYQFRFELDPSDAAFQRSVLLFKEQFPKTAPGSQFNNALLRDDP